MNAAREVRQRLKDVGPRAFVKNSGGKGLHVVAADRAGRRGTSPRTFAQDCRGDGGRRSRPATPQPSRRRTRNRIFVDYLRNSREATAVAAYSTRARPGAAVSTPITWEELGAQTGADRYTVLNLQQRLASAAQRSVGRHRQDQAIAARHRRTGEGQAAHGIYGAPPRISLAAPIGRLRERPQRTCVCPALASAMSRPNCRGNRFPQEASDGAQTRSPQQEFQAVGQQDFHLGHDRRSTRIATSGSAALLTRRRASPGSRRRSSSRFSRS